MNVGDRIEITQGPYKNYQGTIVEERYNGVWGVKLDGNPGNHGVALSRSNPYFGMSTWRSDYLNVLPPPVAGFQPGDRVKLKTGIGRVGRPYQGKTGTVVPFQQNFDIEGNVAVHLDNDFDSQSGLQQRRCWPSDCYTLVSRAPVVHPGELKQGDRVEMVDGVYKGQFGTITKVAYGGEGGHPTFHLTKCTPSQPIKVRIDGQNRDTVWGVRFVEKVATVPYVKPVPAAPQVTPYEKWLTAKLQKLEVKETNAVLAGDFLAAASHKMKSKAFQEALEAFRAML